jgi:hypothetical protein
MAPRDPVPAHVRPDQCGVEMHHLALGDPGRDAGLDRPRQDRAEPLGAPALADAGQAGVVRQCLVQAVADEPPDGEVDLRLAQQPAVMHDPEQQARQHQPDRDFGVDPGPPGLGAVRRLDLRPQPAEVEDPVNPNQDMVVGDQLTQRARHEQLRLPALAPSQHRRTPHQSSSESRRQPLFNRSGPNARRIRARARHRPRAACAAPASVKDRCRWCQKRIRSPP